MFGSFLSKTAKLPDPDIECQKFNLEENERITVLENPCCNQPGLRQRCGGGGSQRREVEKLFEQFYTQKYTAGVVSVPAPVW
jgi:hypothetical protein